MVLSVSISLSIEIVSIVPASLVVICRSQSTASSTGEYVAVVAPIPPVPPTSIFVPLYVETAAPLISCSIVSVIVCCVVVVDCIDPVVNWGVTVFALATAGDNRLKSIIHLVMS